MTNEKSQITMQDVLDRDVITIKLKALIIFLFTFALLTAGYLVGQRGKDDSIMKSQRFGYNSAILDYPGAGFAQSGVTFCFDGKGNYYRTEKLRGRVFTISRDQSVPQIKKEE